MAEDKLKALRYQAQQNETLRNGFFSLINGAIYKRGKRDGESTFASGNLIPLQRGDAFWLIEEIERLRAELAEQYSKYVTSEARCVLLTDEVKRLRDALEHIREEAKGIARTDVDIDVFYGAARYGARTIVSVVDATLERYSYEAPVAEDAAPEPEAPKASSGAVRKFKDGDRVIVYSLGIEGALGTIVAVSPTAKIAPYRVHIDNMQYGFQLKEVELELAVTEPPIRVGDTVRVTKKSSAYHGKKGEVLRVPSSEWVRNYLVRFVVDGFPHVQNDVEYYRNEIEPA